MPNNFESDTEIIPIPSRQLTRAGFDKLPSLIVRAGEKAAWSFIEFFTAGIRNKNTRAAYAQAVTQFFRWCDERKIQSLDEIRPFIIGAYIEGLQNSMAAPSVKQHLAAIRMLFDWLVIGQIVPMNPASSVRGPKHVVKRGKTPVLKADEARALLDSIALQDKKGNPILVGLRDRAIIGLMCFTFARVSAVVHMKVEDYYQNGRRSWFRLHEKGGKRHEVPAHHNAELYLDEYLAAANIAEEKKGPLFRSVDKEKKLTLNPMMRQDVLRMIKRRVVIAGLPSSTSCHTFRATGITAYLENGGTIENAQAIAAHESPRTTKLYDRTSDEITLDEVERIAI
jgi:site-specific recombinase XerD